MWLCKEATTHQSREAYITPRLYPLISQSLIRPCSLPIANCSQLGEIATDEMRPNGVFEVGQLRYTVQDGRWTRERHR